MNDNQLKFEKRTDINSYNGFHGVDRHPAFTSILVAILVVSRGMLGASRCDG
jgi:hypothetical protein